MGCSFSFVCKTCKRVYLLGYQPYGKWFIYPDTTEEYDQIAARRPREAKLAGNQNIRKCLAKHAHHDFNYLYHGAESLEEIIGDSDQYTDVDLTKVTD